jgi:hypothetical protein
LTEQQRRGGAEPHALSRYDPSTCFLGRQRAPGVDPPSRWCFDEIERVRWDQADLDRFVERLAADLSTVEHRERGESIQQP